MKKIVRTKGFILFVTAALVVLAVGISSSRLKGRAGIISNVGGIAAEPLRHGFTAVIKWLEGVYGYMYGYDDLREENEELRAKVAELEKSLSESRDAMAENVRLRALLSLREKHESFVFESARIVSWTASNWASSFTISKGSGSEVEVGDCVITETGYLVGIVTELGTTWATVQTVIDTELEIGAIVERTGDAGLAVGDLRLMREGRLKIQYLDEAADVLIGDKVITSGGGGVYPPGLVIGEVADVGSEESGVGEYAAIKPAADILNLSQVFVVKDFEIVE